MADLLVVTIPERGHINPLLPLAAELERRGHRLTFFAQADLGPALAAAGLAARAVTPPPDEAPAAPPTRGRAFVEALADPAWLRGWIRHLLVDLVPAQLPALDRVLDEVRPDVVVTDPMVYAAVLAASARGLPWAGISSSLNPVTPPGWRCPLVDTVEALAQDRAALFARYGAEPRFRVCDAISPWLNTVFTTEVYAPRAAAENDFSFYVGPVRPAGRRGDETPFPWERLDGRPLVYQSFGSQIYHQPARFLSAARALAGRAQLVCSVGDLVEDAAFVAALGPDVIAVRYAPQLALLERAALLVSHGGANSVMEALAAGVPLVLVPLCNDQHLQARFLAASGAGVVVAPEDFTAARVAEVIPPLLAADAPERARARAIAESYAAKDGAIGAADLVERLAATRAPLRPEAPC